MAAKDWTDDRIERVTALWLEGVSAEAIARQLGDGATRSAVLGKVNRLGLRRTAAAKRQRAPAPSAFKKRACGQSAPRIPPSRVSRDAEPPLGEPPLSATATLMSVRRGFCRWPCGEPGSGDLPVCGRVATRGAYCACHAAISYQRRRPANLFALAGLSET